MISKTVLITGAGGYVGTPLVSRLLSEGHRVIALDTFWFGCYLPQSSALQIVKADLRSFDFQSLPGAIDTVIHLACISNDPSFELNPLLSEDINIRASFRLIDYCLQKKIPRFIFASSSSVYGVKKESQVTETLNPEPLTLYSKSKIAVENYLKSKANSNFDYVILRPATVYGVSSRLRLDVVCNMLTAQAYFEKSISIHGGEQLRPQIHIEKMISAYCACVNATHMFVGAIYNVAEDNYSVKQIAEQIRQIVGQSVDLKFVPLIDTRSYKINSEKFRSKFNMPLNSSLPQGISELVEHFKINPAMKWTDDRFHNVKRIKALSDEPS